MAFLLIHITFIFQDYTLSQTPRAEIEARDNVVLITLKSKVCLKLSAY